MLVAVALVVTGGDSPSGNVQSNYNDTWTPLAPASYGTPGPNPGRYLAGGGGWMVFSDTPGGAGGGGNGPT